MGSVSLGGRRPYHPKMRSLFVVSTMQDFPSLGAWGLKGTRMNSCNGIHMNPCRSKFCNPSPPLAPYTKGIYVHT